MEDDNTIFSFPTTTTRHYFLLLFTSQHRHLCIASNERPTIQIRCYHYEMYVYSVDITLGLDGEIGWVRTASFLQ